MAYPLPTNLDQTCDGVLYCMADWARNVTDGLFWVIMLAGFGMVIFLGIKRMGNSRAYGFASVMASLASLWLSTMQLMAWDIAVFFVLNGLVGMAVLVLNEK